MTNKTLTEISLGAALLVLCSALFVPTSDAEAQDEKDAPKSIRLGVDPDQYLRNRHKRVRHARHQANVRAGADVGQYKPAAYKQPAPKANNQQGLNSLNIPKEYENAPGFNEFSHLSPEEKAHAEEIMQFLKAYQTQ